MLPMFTITLSQIIFKIQKLKDETIEYKNKHENVKFESIQLQGPID